MMRMNLFRAGAAMLAVLAAAGASGRVLTPEEALARAEAVIAASAASVNGADARNVGTDARAVRPYRAGGVATVNVGTDARAVRPYRAGGVATVNVGTDAPYYYIFNRGAGEGYVVATADSRLTPVLAVSDEGEFDPASMPPQLQWWLGQMEAEIKAYLATDPVDEPESRAQATDSWAEIAPLVKTRWAQGYPYNLRTPLDPTDGKQCVTGCVATALSQIIYTNRYINPTGSISYSQPYDWIPAVSYDFDKAEIDFDAMLTAYDSKATEQQRRAVAELMAACGAAVQVRYSSYESSASDLDVAPGLTTYLGYDPEHTVALSRYNPATGKSIPTPVWQEIIYKELAAGRPLYYGGQTPQMQGHGFVCDGYRSPGLFHFNWGWDGTFNGYYALSAMNPGGDGINSTGNGYNCLQTIVLVVPPGAKDTQELTEDIYQGEGRGSFVVTDFEADLVAEEKGTVSFTVVNTGDVEFSDYLYARIFDKSGKQMAYHNAVARPIPVGDIARFSITLDLKGDKGEKFLPGEYILRLTDSHGQLLDPRAEMTVTVAATRTADGFVHPQGGFSITDISSAPDIFIAGQGRQVSVNYRLDVAKTVNLTVSLCRPGTDRAVATVAVSRGQMSAAWSQALRPFEAKFEGVAPGVYDLVFFNDGIRCSARKRVRVGFVADKMSYVANADGETLSVAPGSSQRTVRVPASVERDGREWAVTGTEPEVWMGSGIRRLYLPVGMTSMGRDALRYATRLEALFFESEAVPFEYHQYVAHGMNAEADIFVPAGSVEDYARALPGRKVWSTVAEVVRDTAAVEVSAGASRELMLGLLPTAAGAIDRWEVTTTAEGVATGEATLTPEGVKVTVHGIAPGQAELTVTGGQPDIETVLTIAVGESTGVTSVESDAAVAKGIYDLSGRRLTRIVSPGVYIIDGRKTVVR